MDKVLAKRFLRAANKYILFHQHGVSIGNYYRCKKNNQTACDDCKAVAARYRKAQVAKDPERFKEQKKASIRRNGRPPKRRHRGKGAKSRYYTRKQIFDRDGYNCYLCNEPVDLTAPHVQGQPGWERYPHIEHVIPLAKGGEDNLDNVKIAHAKCNIDKGTTLLDELSATAYTEN